MKFNWRATGAQENSSEVTITVMFDNGETSTFFMRNLPQNEKQRSMRIHLAVDSVVHDHELRVSNDALRTRIEQLNLKARELLIPEEEAYATAPPAPPPFAELLISALAPKNTAQAQLGDLQEIFQKNAARFGEKQAGRMYWMQVAASAWPLIWTWIKRIGLFTALADYVRSKFGL